MGNPPKINHFSRSVFKKTNKGEGKIDPKSMKKSTKNRSNINQKSTKNRSWGRLGASRGHLWASWEYFGTPDAPKTVYFALLVGLGCVLWATRGQHGRNLGPKMEPKSHKNQCLNGGNKSMRLGWAY